MLRHGKWNSLGGQSNLSLIVVCISIINKNYKTTFHIFIKYSVSF